MKSPGKILFRKLILSVICVALAGMVAFPVFWMFVNALKSPDDIIGRPHSILPSQLSVEGFRNIVHDTKFTIYLANSLTVASCVALVATIAALLAAYSLTRIRTRFNDTITNTTLWSYMLSPIMLVLPAYVLMSRLGLVDTLLGLVLVQLPMAFALSFWIAFPFTKDIPVDFEDMAVLDGGSTVRVLLHVLLPLLRPALIAAATFSFLFSWNEYISARIMVSGELKTLPVGIQDVYDSTIVDWSMLMAGSVIMVAPVLILFIGIQKLFIDEWGVGGVKG